LIDKEIDFSAQMKRFDTFLFGRVSYEKIIAMNYPPSPGIENFVLLRPLSEWLKEEMERRKILKNQRNCKRN
jgi:hypothetical protein